MALGGPKMCIIFVQLLLLTLRIMNYCCCCCGGYHYRCHSNIAKKEEREGAEFSKHIL